MEQFVRSKAARAAAAVALTFAALLLVARVETAGAQTPPPANSVLVNGDFEQVDPTDNTLPLGWAKLFTPDPNNFALYNKIGNKTIQGKTFESGGCSIDANNFKTTQFVVVDPMKTYTLGFWSEKSINPSYPNATVNPATTLEFYDGNNNFISPDDTKAYDTTTSWAFYSRTYGPNGAVHFPPSTAKIKLKLVEAGRSGVSVNCVLNDWYGKVTIDNVSLAPIISVGGVAEAPDISRLQSERIAGRSELFRIAAGVAGAAIAATGASLYVNRRRRTSAESPGDGPVR